MHGCVHHIPYCSSEVRNTRLTTHVRTTGLLEEKGVHKEDNSVAAAQSNESVESKASSAGSGKEKTSLKDKIKAKFHKSSQ